MNMLETALAEYGVEEIPGKESNPVIVQYSHDIGYGRVIDEKMAWCSVFMNWCAMKAGLERSGKLNARSWLSVGDTITSPITGDLVIFWRSSPTSWKGHVGIYIATLGNDVFTLGGNQSNKVQISPYDKERVLGYRRLSLIEKTS